MGKALRNRRVLMTFGQQSYYTDGDHAGAELVSWKLTQEVQKES